MSLPTHGDISAQPIGSLVFSLAAAGFDGELTLEQDNRRATLWFARGQVVDAESSYPEDQVLRVMVAASLITNAQVGQTLQKMAQQPDKSPIVLACELGFLRPDLVPRVELHALARRALRPFAMPNARYGFDAKNLPRGPVSEIDARWLVYRGVREYFDGTRLTRELGQLSGMGIKLASAALDAYGFTEPELVVATYLSKGYWEIPDLLDAAISVPQQVALSTIYALCTTGAVDVQPAGSVSLLKKRGPEQTAKVPAAVVQAITAPAPAPAPASASAPVRPAPAVAPASAPVSSPSGDGMVEGFAATQISGASAPVAAAPLPDLDSTALAAGSAPSAPVAPPEGFTPTIEQLAFVRRTPAPPPPPSRPIGPPVGLGGRQDTFDLEEPAPIPERPPVAAPVPVPVVAEPASAGLAFTPSTPTGSFTPAPPSQPFSPAPPSQPFSAPPTGSFRSPGTGSSPNPMLTPGPRPGTYIQGRTATNIPAVPPAPGRPATPAPPGRPATPPPAHAPTQPTATAPPGLRDQILRKFAAIEKGADHFTILELTRDADSAKIKAAYFNLAKLYHPDRVAILKLDDLKPQIERIFAALSQSFAAIGDDARRLEYMKILAQGGTQAVRAREDKEAERAAQIISAEEQFQIGEMAIRRQNWAQAREAFQRAVILNKDEAEHHAYLGWSIFMGASDKNVVLNDVKKHLAKALDINTRCAAAHFFVGKMYLTVGDESRALNAFQHVLDEQPEHVEAQREIRILDMRNKNQKKGGLFDKLRRK